MASLRITPEQLRIEAEQFNRRLTQGLGTLREVGEVAPGFCQREVVLEIDKLKLYHYEPRAEVSNSTPLLICYALVNRPEMADLQADRSLIRSLLDRGLDIYLIDWGYPDGADQYLSLDDYINRYLDTCVDWLAEHYGAPATNLLGICQGGTFSVCYSALHPAKVRNLITTVTPIDFHTDDDMLSHLFKYVDVDRVVDSFGNLPGDFLNGVFLSLKPFRLTQQKYIDMIANLDDPDATAMFVRMEKWIFDSPALARTAFKEFAESFYQRNGLIKGEVVIGGRPVALENVTMPVLNIYAEQDHLVPPAASRALREAVGSADYTEMSFPGGHIGLYVSTRAHKIVPDAIVQWLSER